MVGASTFFLVTIPLWQNFVDLMKLGLTTRQLKSMTAAYPTVGSDLGSML